MADRGGFGQDPFGTGNRYFEARAELELSAEAPLRDVLRAAASFDCEAIAELRIRPTGGGFGEDPFGTGARELQARADLELIATASLAGLLRAECVLDLSASADLKKLTIPAPSASDVVLTGGTRRVPLRTF